MPVSHVQISNEWVVKKITPNNITVTFHAPRSSVYFASKDEISLVIPLKKSEGKQGVRIYARDFKYPKDFTLDYYKPMYVDVELEKKEKKK